jgi:hypoxanthine-guanine phosphoribosyltransferase
MEHEKKEILFTRAVIERRVQELADMISRDYQGKELMVIGILKGAFIFMAVKVASVARQVAPKVTEMQEQLTAASVEIAKVSEAVRFAEAQFNRLADRASTASRRVAKVVDVVPRVIRKVRDADVRAKATVHAVRIVAARTIKAARERSSSSHEVTLK